MRLRHTTLSLAAILAASLVATSPGLAAWPRQSGLNLRVSPLNGGQYNSRMVSDGSGGAIVTWTDIQDPVCDIYAQHVLASGSLDPAWPAGGRGLCTAPGVQNLPAITADGAGGAIVAWQDFRNDTSYVVYAQHVLASGAVDPAWPVNGRLLCGMPGGQIEITMTSDGAGGAIVAWQNQGGVSFDIYAQRVLASGAIAPGWPVNGLPVCSGTFDYWPAITSDGAGGAIVVWQDFRSFANYDTYAQHVLPGGTVDPGWPVNGRAVCTGAGDQTQQQLVSDGSGGAIVTWTDQRSSPAQVYAAHVLSGGGMDAGWPANGRALGTGAGVQQLPSILTDGNGGAMVAWQDNRAGSTNADVYSQHVSGAGVLDAAWPAAGRALCTATGDQLTPAIASDGVGGAIVAWQDARSGSGSPDVYAQHVFATGALDPLWGTNGTAVTTASGYQYPPVIVSDGSAGVIVAWDDYRSGSNYDVYAQRVAHFAYLGTPEAEILGVKDVPNDQGGKVKLSWNASYLDANSDPNLALYEIYRSVPASSATLAALRGVHVLRSFAEARPSEPFLVVQGSYAWEYVSSQNALHYLPSYSLLAPTTGDSTGNENPKTAFMIVVRNTSGSMYWLSAPDSGYSVDDLAPGNPTNLAGSYSGGVAALHWEPNPEADLAGYRLYRGDAAGFTPSPANLVASPDDTLYQDVAGAPHYYKLSAVDIHGNESGFTTLLPAGTLDVTGASVRTLSLSTPFPNPAVRRASFALSLPTAAPIHVSICDAAGRRVRELAQGMFAAGERRLEWDLRDDRGEPVGTGLYFVRARVGDRELTTRIVAIR